MTPLLCGLRPTAGATCTWPLATGPTGNPGMGKVVANASTRFRMSAMRGSASATLHAKFGTCEQAGSVEISPCMPRQVLHLISPEGGWNMKYLGVPLLIQAH